MIQRVQAVYEGGVLRPLQPVVLDEKAEVRITIDDAARTTSPDASGDPLEGLGEETGIADLAERFDDYRFGRRSP